MQYDVALDQALAAYQKADPEQAAVLGGGVFQDEAIFLRYCGCSCRISFPGGEPAFLDPVPPPSTAERILLLQYITGANGLPPRGRWLSFLELPGGTHHYLPFQKEAFFPLAQCYGKNLPLFLKKARRGGAREAAFLPGDAAVVLPVFPRLPLAVLLWAPVEEHPPRAAVLFDSVSETYLPTASLYMMGILAVNRVWL